MSDRFKITWHGAGRTAENPADPRYPDGVMVDLTAGASGCQVGLTYPAAGCGYWEIECLTCGVRVGVTAAGRRDDPACAKLPCRPIRVANADAAFAVLSKLGKEPPS